MEKPHLSLLLATCHNRTLGQRIKKFSKNVPMIVARVSVSLSVQTSKSCLMLYFKINGFLSLLSEASSMDAKENKVCFSLGDEKPL